MPHDGERADAPARWLANAVADLALAKAPLPEGGMYEHLCFHAQQSVEKSLKAVLLSQAISFPFTHNIQGLLDLLPAVLAVSPEVYDAVVLTPYAVLTRYPGEMEPVTEDDYLEAVKLAEATLQWARTVIEGQSG